MSLLVQIDEEIAPLRVSFFNEIYFPLSWIGLDCLLALNGGTSIGCFLKPDKVFDIITGSEAFSDTRLVFIDASREIACDAAIERAIASACHQVNVEVFLHRKSLPPLDCRNKSGNDGSGNFISEQPVRPAHHR